MFSSNQFYEHLKHLIEWEGKQSYYDLDADQQEELTAHYISANIKQRDEFLAQNDNYDVIVGKLLKYMLTADRDEKEQCIEVMKSSACKYFENEISQIFDDAFTEHQSNMRCESKLKKHYHRDNGEVFWVAI